MPSSGIGPVPSDNNAYLSVALCGAINDWLADRWLSDGAPHWGSILTPNHLPDKAAEELDYPPGIALKQDGYLVLAHSEKALTNLDAAVRTQHRFGVPSQILDPEDCVKMVPVLGRKRLLGDRQAWLLGSKAIARDFCFFALMAEIAASPMPISNGSLR